MSRRLLAVSIALPIPFGNVLLALVFQDGIAMRLHLTAAAFAVVMTAGLVSMAWFWGREWLTRWALLGHPGLAH